MLCVCARKLEGGGCVWWDEVVRDDTGDKEMFGFTLGL